MSVTELKKANGEVLKIIDGQYVIGANSGCFSDVACKKIIDGQYVITDCLDCTLLKSLGCFVNITSVEQFYNMYSNDYLIATSDNVNISDTFNFFDEAEMQENRILNTGSVLFTKINCFIKLNSDKEVDFYSLRNGTSYSDLIKNNNIYMFGNFLQMSEIVTYDELTLKTSGCIVISDDNIENNNIMQKIGVAYSNFYYNTICKPILPGEYCICIRDTIEVAFKNSTDKTLYFNN